MKKYTFVLNFGYVESCSLSYIPFTSRGTYRNAKEALIDLSQFLQEQYLVARDLDAADFDQEEFIEWLTDMSHTDIDLYHGEFIQYDYDHCQRWQSDGLEGAPNQRFVYQAGWVITAALGYPHRKEKTFEVICKERTKEKRESFTYYNLRIL